MAFDEANRTNRLFFFLYYIITKGKWNKKKLTWRIVLVLHWVAGNDGKNAWRHTTGSGVTDTAPVCNASLHYTKGNNYYYNKIMFANIDNQMNNLNLF